MKRAPHSSRRNRYTSRPRSWFAAWTVVSAFQSTPCRRRTSRPAITRSKLPLPPLSTRYVSWISRGPSIDSPTRKRVLLEERTPLVVQQRAVGLDRVGDALARQRQVVGDLDRTPEEVEAHHRGLAALPRHRDLRRAGVRLDQLPQVGLQQVVGHPEAAARVEHLLGQEEAVLAVQVADGAGRLGQQMERRGGAFRDQRAAPAFVQHAHASTLRAVREARSPSRVGPPQPLGTSLSGSRKGSDTTVAGSVPSGDTMSMAVPGEADAIGTHAYPMLTSRRGE